MEFQIFSINISLSWLNLVGFPKKNWPTIPSSQSHRKGDTEELRGVFRRFHCVNWGRPPGAVWGPHEEWVKFGGLLIHGWSTYPHVRYTHEKWSFNKAKIEGTTMVNNPHIKGIICHGGTLHGGRLIGHDGSEIPRHHPVFQGFVWGWKTAQSHMGIIS